MMANKKESQLLDNINWEYLKRFKICAESKNFKEAAQKINTSPHALGAQIDSLEESLGFPLFERVNQNRTSKLTPQGERIGKLISMASLYLSGSRPVKDGQILKEEEKQRIRIVTTPGLANTFLSKIIDPFLLKHPHYQVEVTSVGPAVKIQGDEIVIRSDIKDQKDIIKEILFKMFMNLYTSREYIERMGEPFKLDDLKQHKVLTFSALTYGNTNWALLPDQGFPVSTYILSNSIDFLHQMCCQGHGIVELPDIYPRASNLIQVLRNVESPIYPIYLAFHKSFLTKASTADFLTFTLNFFQTGH